jgi:hypothetical protein
VLLAPFAELGELQALLELLLVLLGLVIDALAGGAFQFDE